MAIANDTDPGAGHLDNPTAINRLLQKHSKELSPELVASSPQTAAIPPLLMTASSAGPAAPSASASNASPSAADDENNDQQKLAAEFEDYDNYESLPENTTMAHHLAAGAFAGIMEHTVMFPVDAIKTRMQVAGSANIYSGIFNAITKISAAEGATSLWRGISSMAFGAGPAHAVYFAVYEKVKNTLGGNADSRHHPLITSLAGASATVCSDALMNPFDVIKQRMQLFGSKYRSFANCAADIYRKESFRAFYVSYPTTLIMNVPFTATNFTVYESASKMLNPSRKHDPLAHCVAGALAGGTAAAVTTPLDVIKTLLQTKSMHCYDYKVTEVNSFLSGAKYIYHTQGMGGFLRGIRPRVVATIPSTAISWTAYEMAKFYICKGDSFI